MRLRQQSHRRTGGYAPLGREVLILVRVVFQVGLGRIVEMRLDFLLPDAIALLGRYPLQPNIRHRKPHGLDPQQLLDLAFCQSIPYLHRPKISASAVPQVRQWSADDAPELWVHSSSLLRARPLCPSEPHSAGRAEGKRRQQRGTEQPQRGQLIGGSLGKRNCADDSEQRDGNAAALDHDRPGGGPPSLPGTAQPLQPRPGVGGPPWCPTCSPPSRSTRLMLQEPATDP